MSKATTVNLDAFLQVHKQKACVTFKPGEEPTIFKNFPAITVETSIQAHNWWIGLNFPNTRCKELNGTLKWTTTTFKKDGTKALHTINGKFEYGIFYVDTKGTENTSSWGQKYTYNVFQHVQFVVIEATFERFDPPDENPTIEEPKTKEKPETENENPEKESGNSTNSRTE